MANRMINGAQTTLPKDWTGRLTTENHLGAIWQHKPELISPMVTSLYTKDLGMDLVSYINQFPVEYSAQNRTYEWLLQGKDRKNIALISALDMSGNALTATSKAGQYGSQFILVFPEDYFYADHVIFGHNFNDYQVRIASGPVQDGDQYQYTCELFTSNPALFIPFEELAANTRWSIGYTITEQTLSVRGTGVNHTSPFRMANVLSFMRKEYTVPGNMIDEGKNSPLIYKFRDPITKQEQTTWISKLEWDAEKQFQYEFASLLMYGKSNMQNGEFANKGASGNAIKSGMGLRDQIAPSNIQYYNEIDLDQMVEFSLAMSVGKLPEDSRKMVIATGEYGLREISKAIEQLPSAQAIAYATTDRFKNKNGKRSYETGQFVRYATIQGIEFEFVLQPHYDDDVTNKVKHPTKSGLAESYRMTFLDFGTQNGEANIKRVMPKGQAEGAGVINGLRSPYQGYGTTNAPVALGSKVDGYEYHRWAYGGIKITNPLRTGEFILNVNQ